VVGLIPVLGEMKTETSSCIFRGGVSNFGT